MKTKPPLRKRLEKARWRMTNEQKYKTAEERVRAFDTFCNSDCKTCPVDKMGAGNSCYHCMAYWISLDAEDEKPEPCPFCHKEVVVGFSENIHKEKYRQVWCSDGERCGYECAVKKTEAEAIAAHNRVARAVRMAKKAR